MRRAAIAAACAAGCALSLVAAPGLDGAFGAVLLLLAAAIAVIDWRSLLIPDTLNAAVFALGIARALILAEDGSRLPALADGLARSAALGGALLLVQIAYRRFRGQDGLGLGDVKLGAAGGIWLGWAGLPVAVEIAALSALAVFYLAPRIAGRAAPWHERLPFGVFLAPALWAAWLWEIIVG